MKIWHFTPKNPLFRGFHPKMGVLNFEIRVKFTVICALILAFLGTPTVRNGKNEILHLFE
jgi:hypothetical protein